MKNPRLTREEVEALLNKRDEELLLLQERNSTLYAQIDSARYEGYQIAMREVMQLLEVLFKRDINNKEY